jgi:hypothetical protein
MPGSAKRSIPSSRVPVVMEKLHSQPAGKAKVPSTLYYVKESVLGLRSPFLATCSNLILISPLDPSSGKCLEEWGANDLNSAMRKAIDKGDIYKTEWFKCEYLPSDPLL